MLSFRRVKSRVKIPGFHCHHLIPVEIVEKAAFRGLFSKIGEIGFDYDSFEQNGMYLPCTEENAAAFRLPLHRGPHPVYNQLVSERVATLENLSAVCQLHEMFRFQSELRLALRENQVPLRKTRRNPAVSHPDFDTLELAAFRHLDLHFPH